MQKTSKRRPGELLFSVILLVFSVTAFVQSYAISGFAGKTTPGVFPMLASGCMILAALCLLIDVYRKSSAGSPPAAGFIATIVPVRHWVLIAMVVFYLVAMPYLGFFLSSGLFLLCAFQYLWKRPVVITLVLTIVSLLAIYLVFREVFQIVLPQGSWLKSLR
ncbi:MAG: tripartite tricarboxylate transporter TctB family protein [Granulosicoccus sp.]